MANVTPEREFAFALKAQAEMLMAPMGRTRSGKIQHSSAPSREPNAKRRKKLEGANSPSGMLSPSEKFHILSGSEDVESLGVEVVVEAALSVGADDEQMERNRSVGDTSVAMQIESMPVQEMPQAVQIEVGASTENVPSIHVDESSVKKVPQTNQMEEWSRREKIPSTHAKPVQTVPQMNHVEEGASTEKVPSIQVYARPVQKMSPRNHVYTRPLVKVPKRHNVEEGSLTEKVQSVKAYTRPVVKVAQANHIKEGALTEKVRSIRVYGRPVVKVPQTNHVKEGALIGKVPQGGHVEEASTEKVPSTQVSLGPVIKVPQATHVEQGSSTEDISSIQVDASPVVKVPQANHIEERASTENTSPIQVDAIPVPCGKGTSNESCRHEPCGEGSSSELCEEGASTKNVSSIQVDASLVVKVLQTNHVEEGASTESISSMQEDAGSMVKFPQANHVEEGDFTERASSVQVDASPVAKVPQMNHFEEVDTSPVVKIPLTNDAEEWPMIEVPNSTVVEIPVEIDNGVSQKIEENVMGEEPMRRFTRSLLKADVKEPALPIVEESPVLTAEASSAASGGSVGFEEIKVSADTVNASDEPLRKIALSKFPSNIRDLLATGLLEGLPVKYLIHSYDKQGGLRGVIKGGGILCFCASCKGLNTVSAYNFELHAGSKKKHPSDFICLENGNTIHDVLRACSSAPLDMLESTIQNAISSEGAKLLNTDKCRDSSARSHTGKSALLCDPYLAVKQSPTSPSPSQDSISTSRDLRLHKLVFMDDILPDGTEVAYYARGQRLLGGYIKGSGIFCHCCNTVVSPSQFEAHAGWSSRRKPYLNIYTSNGVSLHELSVSLSKGKKFSTSESDDLCRICGDGGDLLLCDLCPRAFHKECVGVTTVPTGDWYCPCCQNMHLKDKSVGHNENAIAAGRVDGVDPIEEIFKRCIRIAKTPEADVGGCVLCRCHDFSRSGFGPRTVLLCDQCEREFHVGCLKEHNMGDLEELPEGKWFCSSDCGRIHDSLQKLLSSGPEELPVFRTDVIKKKQDDNAPREEINLDIRWRILSGKTASPETRLFLSKALSIFYESFDPIVDFATRKDLIPAMVYGWDLRDQDFGGMYCAVLTVNTSVVSAAILRVLGCEVAELPLVATSRECQGKGYFQSLFSCIEGLLDSLKVKHLVLPAAEEAEAIWTKKFGFSKISLDQLNEYMKGIRTMIFEGTSLLHKVVGGPPKDDAQAGECASG
ncbi:unnamed protein product [Spirodela intermedia]|uniref:PHD-type domain-containing protein n=1 Tax=Spirodela intermedia TaxID=51605 RepID=A0A7I8IXS1_SPIIN|nr:unnamed protein product [Spirodela intermedia]CAA6662599.1 unnamed protein product [Spirodela intermedia]